MLLRSNLIIKCKVKLVPSSLRIRQQKNEFLASNQTNLTSNWTRLAISFYSVCKMSRITFSY